MAEKKRRSGGLGKAARLGGAAQSARRLVQQGQPEAAEAICREVLAEFPRHYDALHLLGIVCHQSGRQDEAARHLRQALEVNPRSAFAHANLGLVLQALGLPGEALECYERALALDAALAQAHNNRANLLLSLQRAAEALAGYERAVAVLPDFAEAWNNRGNALLALNRPAEALASYERALRLTPDLANARYNLGNALLALDRCEEALGSYEQALRLAPGFVPAHYNRAEALRRLGRRTEALAACARTLELAPDHAETHNNRGNLLRELSRHAEALAACDQALALRPDLGEAHNNRGNALADMGRYREAVAAYERALVLQPDFAAAHFHLGLSLLLLGDYERGWPHYEWRARFDRLDKTPREFASRRWQGDDTLTGRTLLLYAEQGLGDTIQFCRYVPLVAARGATVVLEVQPALLPLLAGLEGSSAVLARGTPLPPTDFHCPLPSLPLAFATRLNNLPAAPAYLQADATRAAAWQSRLADHSRRPDGTRIGVVWRGNPAHRNDRLRSIPLPVFQRLFAAGAGFVSLQKDVDGDERTLLGQCANLAQVGDNLQDFADTAAVISQLDAVVAVDTAVAHLAAAMGKPAYILLAHDPDWRWLLERDDSPWYPTARLFRQRRPGDWASVIDEVASALPGSL